MHPDIQCAREAIDKATESMTTEQLSWHPEGKWCTAEILEHLALAFGGTAKFLGRVAADGKSVASKMTLKQRVGIAVVTGGGIIPGGRKAPQGVVPKGMPADQVLPTIRKNLSDMDEAIAACEAKLGTKIKIADHPVLGPLTVGQWRRFHKVHTRHHMKQVVALRAQMARTQKAHA
jgi:DinB superfamily